MTELANGRLMAMRKALRDKVLRYIVENFPMATAPEMTIKRFVGRLKAECRPEFTLALRDRLEMTVPLDYRKSDIRLVVGTVSELPRQFASRKEPWTVEWIESSLRDGDVLYDVGANVGGYSLIAAKQPAKINVIAFEPSFENYAALCANIARNGCEDRITALALALGRSTSLEIFNYQERGPGKALHSLGANLDQHGNVFEPELKQRTLAVTLDDAVDVLCLPRPAALKIDVDGTEMAVLSGGDRLLRDPRVRTLLVEINEPRVSASEIEAFLSQRGLTLTRSFGRPSPDEVLYLLFDRSKPGRR